METNNKIKKNILIIGITGQQGGSVASYLLTTNKYNIRGITRNINSKKSIYLKSKGVEMIECDISDYEKLKKSFEKIDYVYSVTNTDDESISSNLEKEIEYGFNIVNAAYYSGVEFIVCSSLPFVENKNIYSYNNKNRIENYIKEKNMNAVFIYMGFYMDNFNTFFKPILKRDLNNEEYLSFSLPIVNENTKLPLIDVEADLGKIVFNILENKDKYNHEIIHLASEELTIKEIINQCIQVTQKKAIFEQIEDNSLSEDYILMYELWRNNNYYINKTDINKVHELNNNMFTWKKWVIKNNHKLLK